jgi:acetyltransferase-like isoleucine patch superfamily enzyme
LLQNLGSGIVDLGENIRIGKNVRINVSEYLHIGDRSVLNDNVLIEGRHINIGREAWLDEHAYIGGGSCHDWQSCLEISDFLHMGKYSHINIARNVKIGDECGIGINTKIFSHGAYLSAYNGFPVQFAPVSIGDRVWLPNAWVNPGVTIGDDVLVAAMSLVNKDLPSNCLAGGIPARIIKENVYPRELTDSGKICLIDNILADIRIRADYDCNEIIIKTSGSCTLFNLKLRTISGIANDKTELLKNQLRRYGIRFRYKVENGDYVPW